MNETIYVLTAFQKIKKIPDTIYCELGDKRCVGYFNNYSDAKFAIESNFQDIRDNMYDYVVVEEMAQGIKVPELSHKFFKWNETSAKYEPISTPPEVADYSNFGIG